MRALKKDLTTIYYAVYGNGTDTDEWGNEIAGYTRPQAIEVSLSPNRGSVQTAGFGADIQYDREMTVHDADCPIDEFSHLWVDVPQTESHDYIVTRKAPSKNLVRYAIKKVNVNDNN